MPPSAKRRGRSQGRWQGWQRGQRDDFTLSEAGHILWERRVLIAGCTLLFLAVALIYGFSRESEYTAEATLSVRLNQGIGGTDNQGTGAAEKFQEILSGLRNSGAMSGLVQEAVERSGWEGSQRDFDERLEWEGVNNEEVKVRFTALTPEEAARAANAYAQAFVERIGELKGRLAGGTVAVDAQLEKSAEPPERQTGPGMILAAIAAGVGFLVGGAGALFLESRTSRWRGSRDAELTLRAPVLGVIPDYSDDALSRNGGAR